MKKIRESLDEYITEIKPVDGIENVLRQLKKKGFRLGILTSNSEENVFLFLQKNNLLLFDFIYTGHSLFGKHRVINKLIREKKLNTRDLIYIGDETRDIEAAKKSGIKIMAVGWGFNKPKILLSCKPDYFVQYPQEIIEILN